MQELIERHRQDAADGKLAYESCRACGHHQAFVRGFCSRCGSEDLDWKTAAGGGRVAAHSVLHRAPTPDYREKVPYAIALVDLDEGMRVMGHAALDLKPGARVSLSFAPHGERSLLRFDRSSREE